MSKANVAQGIYGKFKYRRNYIPLINEDRSHATEET